MSDSECSGRGCRKFGSIVVGMDLYCHWCALVYRERARLQAENPEGIYHVLPMDSTRFRPVLDGLEPVLFIDTQFGTRYRVEPAES